MKRRDLLKKTLITSGGLWLNQIGLLNKAFAQNMKAPDQNPSFLVLLILDGGWTTNLSLDPWTAPQRPDQNDLFLDYGVDELLKEGDLFLGPAMLDLKSYATNMTIINGIYMSSTDNGHPASQIYMTSGKGSGLAAEISSEFELASLAQTPAGVLYNRSLYTGEKNVTSTSITETSNLNLEFDTEQPFINPQSPIAKAIQLKKQNSARIKEMLDLKSQLEAQGKNITEGHTMALAYRVGLSRSTTYKISPDSDTLDTHDNHPTRHLVNQKNCWQKVKTILDSFKDVEYANGRSMFDVTTFFVTSEFSRTPALDASKGTNHNPMNNSALLIGPNLKPNTAFGASRLVTAAESINEKSYLVGQMVDFATGEVIRSNAEARKRGALIKPETVIATLADALKIQRNIFTPVGLEEKSIQQILKN